MYIGATDVEMYQGRVNIFISLTTLWQQPNAIPNHSKTSLFAITRRRNVKKWHEHGDFRLKKKANHATVGFWGQ